VTQSLYRAFPRETWKIDKDKIKIFDVHLTTGKSVMAFPEFKGDRHRWRNVYTDEPINPELVRGWKNFPKTNYVIWDTKLNKWKICQL